jgi:hypothetical protein
MLRTVITAPIRRTGAEMSGVQAETTAPEG